MATKTTRRTILEPRDQDTLRAIAACDGMMTSSQIHAFRETYSHDELKAKGKTGLDKRGTLNRIEALCEAGYVMRPTPPPKYANDSTAKSVICLGAAGASWIADHADAIPTHWRKEPAWGQLTHDLMIGDLYLAVYRSLKRQPHLKLELWVSESAFRALPQPSEINPDAFFVISDSISHPNQAARLLVQVDNMTHTHADLDAEVSGDLAFLTSPHFLELSGVTAGRWLRIFTNAERMQTAKERTRTTAQDQAYAFLFSTIEAVTQSDPLTDPIWHTTESESLVPLITQAQPA